MAILLEIEGSSMGYATKIPQNATATTWWATGATVSIARAERELKSSVRLYHLSRETLPVTTDEPPHSLTVGEPAEDVEPHFARSGRTVRGDL